MDECKKIKSVAKLVPEVWIVFLYALAFAHFGVR